MRVPFIFWVLLAVQCAFLCIYLGMLLGSQGLYRSGLIVVTIFGVIFLGVTLFLARFVLFAHPCPCGKKRIHIGAPLCGACQLAEARKASNE